MKIVDSNGEVFTLGVGNYTVHNHSGDVVMTFEVKPKDTGGVKVQSAEIPGAEGTLTMRFNLMQEGKLESVKWAGPHFVANATANDTND